MIPAVIVVADKHVQKAKRLAQFCRELDGTEITLLYGEEAQYLPYPHCNTATFHLAANHFKGKPFFWMEPDAIPLSHGWLAKIDATYSKAGKEFLLSSDSHPPHDLVGGIGVYGPDSHWLLPKYFSYQAWDGWMIKHLPDLIAQTPLIQHRYAIYRPSGGIERRLTFPKDKALLRQDAVIFHSDPDQTLIP